MNVEQALEMARCAYINLNNVVKMNPGLGRHPIFIMAKRQLSDAIVHLDGGDFCEIEDEGGV